MERCKGCQPEKLVKCGGCGKPTCVCQDTSIARYNLGRPEGAYCIECRDRDLKPVLDAIKNCRNDGEGSRTK